MAQKRYEIADEQWIEIENLSKVVNHGINQHIGLSSGGHTTTIYTIVDGLGNPTYFKLSSGFQTHSSWSTDKIFQNENFLCFLYPIYAYAYTACFS